MVATRRSRNLDVIEQTPSNIQNDPLPRTKSNMSKNASSSTASSSKSTTVDNDPKENVLIRHSARLRKESPSPPASSRPSRNASRTLDSDFEWESHAKHRSIGRNYKTRELDHTDPRRSSRHQPSHNVSLEKDYIEYNSSDIEVQYDRTAKNREGTDQSQETEEKGERKRREPNDLLAVHGKKLYIEPDIYSCVKSRVRVGTRDKLYQEYFTQGTSKNKQQEGEESQSEEIGEEEDEDDGEHTNGEEEEEEGHPYKLRKVREAPKRYMIVREVQRRRPRSLFEDLPCSPARRRRRRPPGTPGQTPYLKRRRRARTQGNSSTSSDSSSSDDEIKFRTRQQKSISRSRNECLPINLSSADLSKHSYARERKKIGQALADIDPMGLDTSVTFSSVGGHNKHIRALKEMVVFPLLYPEVFEKFSITPPRGCLFYGPPGTGKTLMARALANECSTEGKKVSFFMKKGADCLSKWIGESERQLRVLFDQAYQMRPSIIFFDEIDGLAPVRSSRQDQIHSSIVSTLLALMDGLDSRGEIIVIGATNRIDSIDPALRRPGRFDREFLFPLPDKQAREAILQIHTKDWNPQLKQSYIEYLAAKTVGYCGADVKALCTEAALTALRRRYPQIYESREKLQLNVDSISIQAPDFHVAVKSIIPTAQRSASNPGRALSCTVRPLLGSYLQRVVLQVSKLFPVIKRNSKVIQIVCAQQTETKFSDHIDIEHDFEVGGHSGGIYVGDTGPANQANPIFSLLSGNNNGVVQSQYSTLLSKLSSVEQSLTAVHRPRLIVCGDSSSGNANHLAPALLHDMEGIPVHCLDLPALYGISVRTPEESCAQVFREARRAMPSVIYLPNALRWWTVASATLQATLEALLQDIPPHAPILFLAAANCTYLQLPRDFAKFFHSDFHEVYDTEVKFYPEQRREFFAPLFLIHAITPPPRNKFANPTLEALPKAPAPEPAPLTEEEEKRLEKEEESTLRNLRLFLRDILIRLERDRRFKIFSKPVDFEEVPDYIEVIKNPMDFSTAQTKIDQHKYQTVGMFLDDIDLICNNALEYNPDRRPEDKLIRHRACSMRDMAHAIADTDLEPEFEKLCQEVVESRKRRGVSMNKSAPKFYPVLPKHLMIHPITDEITPKPDCQPLTDSNPTAQIEQQAEKTRWTPNANASKRKKKRSTWSRGILAKVKKKKKVVNVIEFGEDEDDKAEDDYAKDEDVEDENHQESEGEMTDCEDFHKNEEEEVIEIPTSPQQDEQIQTGKENLSVSFENGTGMEINIDHDSGKDSTSRQEQNMEKTDEESHALSNGYGLDDILQDEIESACAVSPPGVKEIPSLGEGEEEEEKDSHSPDSDQDVTEVQESQEEEPAAPKRMMLRSRNGSTLESSRITKSKDVEKPPCPPPPPFIVDHKTLLKLLEDVVLLTESYTLDELERAHASLSRCMEKYRMEYDRTALTEDLEKEIQSFSLLMGTKSSDQHSF